MSNSRDIFKKNLEIFIAEKCAKPFGGELATVTSVDFTEFTLTATGQATNRPYQDVRFVTVPSEMQSIICVPKVNSTVLIMDLDPVNSFVALSGELIQTISNAPSMINNIVEEFVIQDNEDLLFQLTPEAGMEFNMSDVVFKVNNDGMKLSVGSADFKTGVSDLKLALEQLTVNTPNGPSSPPINISAITAAMQKILDCLQ